MCFALQIKIKFIPFSENNHIPVLNAEEVGELLNLDSKTIDWLAKQPVNENAILVLSFQESFVNNENFALNKQAISTALVCFLFFIKTMSLY